MPSAAVIHCAQLLISKGITIAFAESATGGRLCAEFTLAPNAGTFLKGAIISYDVRIKKTLLRVPKDAVEHYTAESSEVTRLMTHGLKTCIHADLYVAVTGLTHAGGSEHVGKPVGTMFIHILDTHREISLQKIFDGDPEAIILQTVEEIALQLIRHCGAE